MRDRDWWTAVIVSLVILLMGGLCGVCFAGSVVFAAVRRDAAATPAAEITASPNGTENASVLTPATRMPTSTLVVSPQSTGTLLGTPPASAPVLTDTSTTTAFTATPDLTETSGVPSATHAPIAADAWCVPWNTGRTNAEVLNVIDGVTIEVNIGGEGFEVRYIGMDLPDFSSDFEIWKKSKAANESLVFGREVLLVKDKSEIDNQGRLLRYVIADGVFINYQLIAGGFGVASSYPPDVNCDYLFAEAENLALATNRGVWALTPTPTRVVPTPTRTPLASGIVVITTIQFEGAKLRDEQNEFVEIRNSDTQPIQLGGWTLRNNRNRIYTFPNYIIQPGQYCRIYTNEYHPDTCGFSFFSLSPIWEDFSDCAFLMDNQGVLIDSFCYG